MFIGPVNLLGLAQGELPLTPELVELLKQIFAYTAFKKPFWRCPAGIFSDALRLSEFFSPATQACSLPEGERDDDDVLRLTRGRKSCGNLPPSRGGEGRAPTRSSLRRPNGADSERLRWFVGRALGKVIEGAAGNEITNAASPSYRRGAKLEVCFAQSSPFYSYFARTPFYSR